MLAPSERGATCQWLEIKHRTRLPHGRGGARLCRRSKELTRIERIAKGRTEIASFAASQPTIELVNGPVAQAGALPEPVDLFWICENYHDLHNAFMAPVDIGAFNAAMFRTLKPGGRLIIIDHVAAKGAPQDVTETLHRIEPAVARREIEVAGFKRDGESVSPKIAVPEGGSSSLPDDGLLQRGSGAA
jgi:predicted methyltransferase